MEDIRIRIDSRFLRVEFVLDTLRRVGRRTTQFLLVLSLICGAPLFIFGQAPFQGTQISADLAGMRDGSLSTRKAAFDQLIQNISREDRHSWQSNRAGALGSFLSRHPEQSEQIKRGLINLLAVENEIFISGEPGSRTEDDGEYYAEVIDTVASLHDDRAIPALVGAMSTGGMAVSGLMKYGDKAIPPVLEKLKSPDAFVRASALRTSVDLLQASKAPGAQEQLHQVLLSSLQDKSYAIRSLAVLNIGCLDDRQKFVPLLEQIAKTDPAKSPGLKPLDGGDNGELYPVRYDARLVLREIASNKGCE
jgi:hypothetical protein